MLVLTSWFPLATQPPFLLLDMLCMYNFPVQCSRHQLTCNSGATISSAGLWHYPATITDPSTTWEVAQFGPADSFTSTTTAAVINQFGKRQQMVWFTSFATDWSTTSTYLQHSYIHWVTRGLCKFHILVSHPQILTNAEQLLDVVASSWELRSMTCTCRLPCTLLLDLFSALDLLILMLMSAGCKT